MNTNLSVPASCFRSLLFVTLLCVVPALTAAPDPQALRQAQAEFQQNATPLIEGARSARDLARADIDSLRLALTAAYQAQTASQIDVNNLNKKSAAIKSDLAEFHDRITTPSNPPLRPIPIPTTGPAPIPLPSTGQVRHPAPTAAAFVPHPRRARNHPPFIRSSGRCRGQCPAILAAFTTAKNCAARQAGNLLR